MEVIRIEPGRNVICDDCSVDWTDRTESGGILFHSKAICPKCEHAWRNSAIKYDEQHFIRGECPKDKSFADWVRQDLR